MSSIHFRIVLEVLAPISLLGFGFAVYRYPKFFANLDLAFGAKWPSSPRILRAMGVAYMAAAIVTAVVLLAIKP